VSIFRSMGPISTSIGTDIEVEAGTDTDTGSYRLLCLNLCL